MGSIATSAGRFGDLPETAEIGAVPRVVNAAALMLEQETAIARWSSRNIRAPQCLEGVKVTFQPSWEKLSHHQRYAPKLNVLRKSPSPTAHGRFRQKFRSSDCKVGKLFP